MINRLPYVMSEIPNQKDIWYAHHRDLPDIPIFGSIGDKKKAMNIARIYNDPYRRRGK